MKNSLKDRLYGRAKAIIGFKIHLLVFSVLIPVQWGVWMVTNTEYMWPVWPTVGWGIGLLIHWIIAFHLISIFSVQKEYEKLKRNNTVL